MIIRSPKHRTAAVNCGTAFHMVPEGSGRECQGPLTVLARDAIRHLFLVVRASLPPSGSSVPSPMLSMSLREFFLFY